MAHARGPDGEGLGTRAEAAHVGGLVGPEGGEGGGGRGLVEVVAEGGEVGGYGGEVGRGDPGLFERCGGLVGLWVGIVVVVGVVVVTAALELIGNSCVCAVFVVTPGVDMAVVIDTSVDRFSFARTGAVVVVVVVIIGLSVLRAGSGQLWS